MRTHSEKNIWVSNHNSSANENHALGSPYEIMYL